MSWADSDTDAGDEDMLGNIERELNKANDALLTPDGVMKLLRSKLGSKTSEPDFHSPNVESAATPKSKKKLAQLEMDLAAINEERKKSATLNEALAANLWLMQKMEPNEYESPRATPSKRRTSSFSTLPSPMASPRLTFDSKPRAGIPILSLDTPPRTTKTPSSRTEREFQKFQTKGLHDGLSNNDSTKMKQFPPKNSSNRKVMATVLFFGLATLIMLAAIFVQNYKVVSIEHHKMVRTRYSSLQSLCV
jgi:hypothetical protein